MAAAYEIEEDKKRMETDEKMNVLVVYYSLHGHTKKVGDAIARKLGAKVEVIKDTKDRSHLKSWSQGAFDEELRLPTIIAPLRYNPKDFDLVVIGTPIWDGISPPIYTYLIENECKKVAFFVTFGAAAQNAVKYMEKLSRKKSIASVEIQDRQIEFGESKEMVDAFCKEIKKK